MIMVGRTFIACTLFFILLNLIVPDRKSSEQENRMLTQKPDLNMSDVLSGHYMQQYEDYLSDQFAGRSFWRSFKIGLNRLGGSREENGVFLGKRSQLLEDVVTPDPEALSKNLEAIKSYSDRYPDVNKYMILVPDAAEVLGDRLPPLATVANQTRMINHVKSELGDSLKWIDAAKALKRHADEKIYYKTDHHWTSLGAFLTFQEAAETMGIQTDFSSGFASYPVTTSFNGMLASKSGYALDVMEEISIYVPRGEDNEVLVNYVDEQKRTTSIYDSSKLKTRDKQAVFLGGNTSVIDIKTLASGNRRLLIVKDSFANSFVQFLTPFFREIIIVDPRYYTGTIDEVMNTYRISDVLFLYRGNTFFQDNNISGVMSSD